MQSCRQIKVLTFLEKQMIEMILDYCSDVVVSVLYYNVFIDVIFIEISTTKIFVNV